MHISSKFFKRLVITAALACVGLTIIAISTTSLLPGQSNDTFHNAAPDDLSLELNTSQQQTLNDVRATLERLREKNIIFSGETIQAPDQTTVFFADPEQAKAISDSAETTYYSEIETIFSQDNAQQEINKITTGIEELKQQLSSLDDKYGDTDPQYLATREEVVRIITSIEKTKNALEVALKKIYFYQKDITASIEQVKQIRNSLDKTKSYVAQFAQFMYKVQNEFYQQNGTIDEVKLFIKSDKSISDQLSNTALIENIMKQMNELLAVLNFQEKATIGQIKNSNQSRMTAKELILEYNGQLKDLQEKKDFLSNYLTLYESNKLKMSKELSYLFSTQKDVYTDILTTVDLILSTDFNDAGFDVEQKIQELNATDAYAKRDEKAAPLSWPLYPIDTISRYFGDQDYEQAYGVPFKAIEIPAEQNTPLYAVDEGLVYKIANKDSIGLNRILLLHKGGRMTIYLYPNSLLVQEGDIVRRGQIIGYSGGEPGTKGAGFVAGGPNLSFMVVDKGTFVDPLEYLDLSVVNNTLELPTTYKFKYLKDKYNLPRDLYAVKPVAGDTLQERRNTFIQTYGVGVYKQESFWQDAAEGSNIDIDVGICIAFAESTLGRNLTTANNIGNVGNNDRGDRVGYENPLIGTRLIYSTLNNGYLGHYNILLDYNGYGNPDGKNYATSQYNWQNNVIKCLTMIKGYYVPDDFPVRIAPNPNRN